MDALVMCGGRGTRLDAQREKPLVRIAGEPMIDRVIDALVAVESPDAGAGIDPREPIDAVHAAVSPHAPETAAHLRDRTDVETVETPGEGYVADLGVALEAVERPVLTVVADLPLLAPDAVAGICRAWARAANEESGPASPSLTVRVPVERKRRLGASVDDRVVVAEGGCAYLPAGINVVGENETNAKEDEIMHTTYDARLAVNVNRQPDLDLAEGLLCD